MKIARFHFPPVNGEAIATFDPEAGTVQIMDVETRQEFSTDVAATLERATEVLTGVRGVTADIDWIDPPSPDFATGETRNTGDDNGGE